MAPIYSYQCEECGGVTEAIRPISERQLPQRCDSCGAGAALCFSLVVCKTYPAYNDAVMGEVRSYGHEKRLLKKHGKKLVAETAQWDKFKEQRKKAIRKPIYSTSVGKRTSVIRDGKAAV